MLDQRLMPIFLYRGERQEISTAMGGPRPRQLHNNILTGLTAPTRSWRENTMAGALRVLLTFWGRHRLRNFPVREASGGEGRTSQCH
jgi:hypothetical protein